MLKELSVAAGIVVMLVSGVVAVETRYGKSYEVAANAVEIARIKLERRLKFVQQRIWALEGQFGYDLRRYPPQYRREYQELKAEEEQIKRELARL